MFPYNNRENPFEPFNKKPCHDDYQNPNIVISKQDEHPMSPFFFNLPSPFFDEHDLPLNQMFSQNQLMNQIHDERNVISDSSKKEKITKKSAENQPIIEPNGSTRRQSLGEIPRRIPGKKDRHSKICTAQGIRDRRMRLSLQIARKFFDLQDLLGFDKASKTIEWLFCKSKKAIKELMNTKELPIMEYNNSISNSKSESFISECEVLSGIEENHSGDGEKTEQKLMRNEKRKSQKKVYNKPSTKESRDEARARARSRTREKMILKSLQSRYSSPNCVQKLGFPFEGVEQEKSSTQNQEIRVSTYGDYALIENDQLEEDLGRIEKFLGYSSRSDYQDYHCSGSSSKSCEDPNNINFMEYLGNWEMLSNDRLNPSTHEFAVTNDQVSVAGNYNYDLISSAYNLGSTSNVPSFDP